MLKVLREMFLFVEYYIEYGVFMVYVRIMKGGVIYLFQSNCEVDDDFLSEILWYESNGYFRLFQRVYEGVKIEKKVFEVEFKVLFNIIKVESFELRVFLKYGRSLLEQ